MRSKMVCSLSQRWTYRTGHSDSRFVPIPGPGGSVPRLPLRIMRTLLRNYRALSPALQERVRQHVTENAHALRQQTLRLLFVRLLARIKQRLTLAPTSAAGMADNTTNSRHEIGAGSRSPPYASTRVAAAVDTRALHWTRNGLMQGIQVSLPAIPMMAAFGIAFGATAAQKGLALAEATLMSALVFAGASQFVATEIWVDSMTLTGLLTLGIVTAIVNMRFILMGASLRRWLDDRPRWETYPALSLMTDPGWLIATRYRAEGGVDAAFFLSSGFTLWVAWIVSTPLGHMLGALVTEPRRLGLDLVLPIYFAIMLVPLWRGPRRAIAWLVAGITAVLVSR